VTNLFIKCRAVLRRGLPSLRNAVFAKLGIWPVGSLAHHWLADLPTLCVSLPHATRRRQLIQSQVERMGLRQFDFIDAVDAAKLSFQDLIDRNVYDSEKCRRFHTRDLTLKEIACSLSHAAAYQRIVEQGYSRALVIEDDALFRTSRLARLRIDDVPPETDLLFLNAFLTDTPPKNRVGSHLFRDTSYNGSAAAYIVTQDAARRLLAEAIPVVHAADGLTGRVLALTAGESHPFRQQGVSISMSGMIVYPEAVTNGSVEHYHTTSIR
jgi:glycosyl transferase family 25